MALYDSRRNSFNIDKQCYRFMLKINCRIENCRVEGIRGWRKLESDGICRLVGIAGWWELQPAGFAGCLELQAGGNCRLVGIASWWEFQAVEIAGWAFVGWWELQFNFTLLEILCGLLLLSKLLKSFTTTKIKVFNSLGSCSCDHFYIPP